MGCDFELQIQCFYTGKWVSVVFFGTKTRCGGYPLMSAIDTLFYRFSIKGDFHRNDPTSFDVADTFYHMGLPQEKPLRKKRCEYEDDAEYYERKYASFMYYSKEEIIKFIDVLHDLTPPHDSYSLYARLMAPIPEWMEMAKNCLPNKSEIWLEEEESEIKNTTKKLETWQNKLYILSRDVTIDLLSKSKIFRDLPVDLVEIIVVYAVPHSSMVRLAFWDDEGQCESLIKEKGNK